MMAHCFLCMKRIWCYEWSHKYSSNYVIHYITRSDLGMERSVSIEKMGCKSWRRLTGRGVHTSSCPIDVDMFGL